MLQEFVQAVKDSVQDSLKGIHTAMPGKVVSLDTATGLAVIQPTMKFKKPDGTTMDYSQVSGVPVVFPQGMAQGATVAFPVKAGDSGLLVIAEQSIDYWLYGQETDTDLAFDLTNAIFFPGLFAKANAVMKAACEQSAVVVDVKGTRLTVKAGKVQIDAAEVVINGNTTVNASFSKVVKTLPFTDVSEDDYFFDAVVWAVENGVTYGNTATTFGVGVTCNRADAVTFIWRAYGCPAPKNRDNPFTDVADSAYYADAVLWAVENGVTVGTSATTFSPLESCRREHIVTFLYRAAGSPAVSHSSGFVDVADSAYYANAVTWAAENGITVGAGSTTTFGPTQNCFREQIVTFLYRNLAE